MSNNCNLIVRTPYGFIVFNDPYESIPLPKIVEIATSAVKVVQKASSSGDNAVHLVDVQSLIQKALTGAQRAVVELEHAKRLLQDEDNLTTLGKQLKASGELDRMVKASLGTVLEDVD